MKLVELLARELSEWPDGCTVIWQSAMDLEIYFDGCNHKYTEGSVAADDRGYKGSHITRAQWQAERERQNGGEWKRHRGGDKPKSVSDGEMVEVRLRSGDIQESQADDFIWNHGDCDESANITKYRVISQPQAEEVEVKDTTIGTLSYKVEIDTTDASHAIDELAAKWDQFDGPLRWRDCVNELDAYIEEFTRERESLINRLALEGFALLPAMAPVMGIADVPAVDMGDWRNWQKGDVVEVILKNDAGLPVGKVCTVARIEKAEYIGGMPVAVDDDDGDFYWPEDDEYDGRLVFKFVSRP